jgi:DNA-binding response OmpR family regulator
MKILLCDDHTFYSKEIVEKLREDGHTVVYASNFKEAEKLITDNKAFDISILDVILQNGKTGIHLAEKYKSVLGRIMFVTGCIDDTTVNRLNGSYACASKAKCVIPPIDEFLKGGTPQITL